MSPLPDEASDAAVAIVLGDILHEVRRARARPIFHIHRGGSAGPQQAAVTFGWLTPAAEPRLLRLTEAGRRALSDADASRNAP